jgi:glucokinase
MTTQEPDARYCLIGDVGGSKVLLATIRQENDAPGELRHVRAFESRAHGSLESIIASFLEENAETQPRRAIFAVAGPVVERRARITNLPWTIDADRLSGSFPFQRVDLINDLEALAWAIPILERDRLAVLHPGVAEEGGTIAVLAPGTGLGEAYLTATETGYVAHPSEGGHADFAPANERQARLLTFLWEENEHVSVERIASGMGLPNLHRFICSVERTEETPEVEVALDGAEDPTRIIIEAAIAGRSSACTEAVRLFVEILAAEVGTLALKVLASGGVFIGGGIPPRIQPFFQSEAFRAALLRKGRFRGFMERVPVSMILDPHSVLRGAAVRAAGTPIA